MDAITANMPLLVFIVIGTIAVASSLLVVMMRNPVHSAIFLLITFLCVATLFVMKGAEFVGAVQVLVYAGGIMVLFLFVVMLINVRHLPEERVLSNFWKGGFAVGLGVFILLVAIVRPGVYHNERPNTPGSSGHGLCQGQRHGCVERHQGERLWGWRQRQPHLEPEQSKCIQFSWK